MLDPLSIITMGHVVTGGKTTAINVAGLGYIINITEEIIKPHTGGWPNTKRKLIRVTITCEDGTVYTDEAYTTNMNASADDVEIIITDKKPTVIFKFKTL